MLNVSSKPLVCNQCGLKTKRTSNRQVRCEDCSRELAKIACKQYYRKTYVKKGYNQSGENNNNWVSGIGTYREKMKHIKKCESCNSKHNLLVHHKDENRENNDPSNLEKLCKKCHQKLHKCWEVLPKGKKLSRLKARQAKKAIRDESGKFVKSHKV